MGKYICEICQSFYNPLYAFQFDELIKLGFDCRVFYFTTKDNDEVAIQREYMEEYRAYKNIDRFIFAVKEFKIFRLYLKYLGKYGLPTLNHAHTLFTAGSISYLAYKKYGIPYVVTVRNVDINHFFKKRLLLRRLGIIILKNASSIIFLSNTAKNEVSRIVRDSVNIDDKSYVITNGLDNFWLENRARHSLCSSKKTIKVIYFGDINSNKNIINTVKALDLLEKDGFDINYTVIGKIKEKHLNNYLSRNYIKVYDFMQKEELINKIKENDVFVMPSFTETFGLAYLEAMSQGLPIIYTKNQGFDGLFPDGEVGFSVNPYSPENIAQSILKIMSNYDDMSVRAYEAVAKFEWSYIATKIANLYKNTNNLVGS